MKIEVKQISEAFKIPVINMELLKKCNGKHKNMQNIFKCASCNELLKTAEAIK